jgi:hypothetical protein
LILIKVRIEPPVENQTAVIARRTIMRKSSSSSSTRIVLAAALLLGEISLATAQNALPNSGYPGVAGGANGNPFRAGINETTSVPSVPYYGPIYDYYPVPYYAPSHYGSPYYYPGHSAKPPGGR